MLMTTDTLYAAKYIKEQFGQQDVNGLTEKEVMSLVESIRSLDVVVEAVASNQEFDLYAVDRLLTITEWVRTQVNMKKVSPNDHNEFKKKAKLFSNFVNRLIEYRIKKYNEMTSLDRFINGYGQ
ncbi:hypothetical protein EVJ32_04700 [Exiguobacterium sp. SH5S4]|uniref:hypothetical protein n=1 Tax=Exiguobacterium sp. SH5S4 TaxID=2510961 RepID=UPI00103DB7C0|nr:hypothetical protein [Exiguobacterium sp. SH5S4]TCI26677.1 hypothetical protein EVJ32_04700 [Exiguobacterium sp. SH5S4]